MTSRWLHVLLCLLTAASAQAQPLQPPVGHAASGSQEAAEPFEKTQPLPNELYANPDLGKETVGEGTAPSSQSAVSETDRGPEGQNPDVQAKLEALQRSYDEAPQDDPQSAETAYDKQQRPGHPVLRYIYGLSVTFALLALFLFVLHKVGRRTPLLAGHNIAKILGKVHLDPRACLYFVRVCRRVLVLGVTRENISVVGDFDAAPFEKEAVEGERPARQEPQDFLAELKESIRGMDHDHEGDRSDDDAEISALRDNINRLQRYLRDSSRELEP